MKRITPHLAWLAAGLLATLLPICAQGAAQGTAFTYQGRLDTAVGPATGSYDFEFSLWNALSSGGQVGAVYSLPGTAVSNGLFTVTLDFGAAAFTGDARWLQIAVRATGDPGFSTLDPRQALQPAPGAIYANNAGTATTAAIANGVVANTVTAAGILDGSLTAADVGAGQVVKSLNGLTDQVLLSAGTNIVVRTVGNNLTVSAGPWTPFNVTNTWFTGGQVGIGSTPQYGVLDVFGGTASSDGASLHVGGTGINGDPKLIHFGDMQSSDLGYVYLGENGEDDTLELRAARFFFNHGYVGVLKTNPATALDVNGTVTANAFNGGGAGLTGISTAGLSDSAVTSAKIQDGAVSTTDLAANSVTAAKLASDVASLAKVSGGLLGASDGYVSFATNAFLDDMDLFLRGDVYHGIGWYGNPKLFGTDAPNGPVAYGFNGGGLGTKHPTLGTNLLLGWSNFGVIVDPGSRNTNGLNWGLTFGANSGEGIASKRDADGNQFGLDFYTDYASRLTITQGGKVGVGTTSPATALDVNGTVTATGFSGPGAGLTGVIPADNSVTSSKVPDGSLTAADLASGQVVKSLNSLKDNVTIAGGANVTVIPAGQTLTVASPTDWHLAGNAGTTAGTDFIGTTDNQPLEFKVNGKRAMRLEPATGSSTEVNVIGGSSANSVASGTMGATIGGGTNNLVGISAHRAVIGGGTKNQVVDNAANAGILGGSANRIGTNSYGSVIGGGDSNQMIGNTTDGAIYGVIGGGRNNTLEPYLWDAFIGGGILNRIQYNAWRSVIPGGIGNRIGTNSAWSGIAGGGYNTIERNSSEAAIGGGTQNTISSDASLSLIAGGSNNVVQASAVLATIGGGMRNSASGPGAFIGGGGYDGSAALGNTASGAGSVVVGGTQNATSGSRSTVGGGHNNVASGWYATVPGGAWNVAGGQGSFAAGQAAKALHEGTFVWNDTASDFSSTGPQQFLIHAAGNVGINKNNPATALDVNGTATATAFSGSGSGLTALNGSQLTSGTVPLARLPSEVVLNNESGVTLGSLNVSGITASSGTIYADADAANPGTLTPGLILGGSSSGEGIASKRTAGTGQYGLDFYTANALRMTIHNLGNVGINKNNPATALDVNGVVTATGFSGPGVGLTGVNADLLDGQHGSFYQNAANLNAGTVPLARLPSEVVLNNESGVTLGSLSVSGTTYVDGGALNSGAVTPGLIFGGTGSSEGIASKRTAGGNQYGLDFFISGSSRMSIANSGNVGIGITLPSRRLQVVNADGLTGDIQVGPQGSGSGAKRVYFGDAAYVYAGESGADDRMELGAETFVFNASRGNGRIGMGRVPAAYKLEVEGDASKTTAGLWFANSDARIKTGTTPVTNAMEKLAQVRLVSFRYTDDYRRAHPSIEDRSYLNVVAQEFQQVFPESVKPSGEQLPGGSEILSVDTYPLVIYSAAAVQELNQKLQDKEAELQALRQRLSALEKAVAGLTGKQ